MIRGEGDFDDKLGIIAYSFSKGKFVKFYSILNQHEEAVECRKKNSRATEITIQLCIFGGGVLVILNVCGDKGLKWFFPSNEGPV